MRSTIKFMRFTSHSFFIIALLFWGWVFGGGGVFIEIYIGKKVGLISWFRIMNGNGIDQATQARASSFPNEGPINTIHINANCPDALITTLK